MNIQSIMEVLSQCQLGAMVITEDYRIEAINEIGKDLLFSDLYIKDDILPEHYRPLCEESSPPVYVRVSFQHYVTAHPAPKVTPVPNGCRLVVFRDATKEYRLDVMLSVCNHLSEGIVICDGDSRMSYINDPAMKMDMIIEENVLGETIGDIYHMSDSNAELPLPKTLRTRTPMLNYRQRYVTRHGKEVNAVANTWPIIKNGQLLGAFNILEDWSTVSHLHRQIVDLQEKLVNQDAKQSSKSAFTTHYSFEDIICVSEKMQDLIVQCRQVAKADSAVMIYGETGTGKELFAQSIHHASRRADGPFLAVNCAALPENLLESLLFGSVKGAYTGAENRTGLFEQANHGTLLLDEINSMHISLQAKLLRVLQEGTIRKLGDSREIRVDVRVLSCINIPPRQAIAEGKLRQDLFYRLGVVCINIPPLRKRKGDIPYLVRHFISEYNRKFFLDVTDISPEVKQIFFQYSWPGNVRELQHAIEHAMNVLPDGASVITEKYIPQALEEESGEEAAAKQFSSEMSSAGEAAADSRLAADSQGPSSLEHTLHDVEYDAIIAAMQKNRGNITRAARDLKISRQNLQYRLKRYGIDASVYRQKH